MERVRDYFFFFGSEITVDDDCSYEIKRQLLHGRKTDKPRQLIKSWRHFADKALWSQSYGFSSSDVQMWDLDHNEGR